MGNPLAKASKVGEAAKTWCDSIIKTIKKYGVVFTLVVLVYQVHMNTEALLSGNRQSLSQRVEELLLSQANTPEFSEIHLKATGRCDPPILYRTCSLTEDERVRYVFYFSAAIRIAEEAYLQYHDGQLEEEYWQTRANNLLYRMRAPVLRKAWMDWRGRKMFTDGFSSWLNNELCQKSCRSMR